MTDIFDNKVLCKDCDREMKHATLIRNGFELRALICQRCENKIIHPEDEEEYKRFLSLRGKVFKVKMRIVGNSYAVSIPKEIVDFMHEQEKIMNDMVQLCFEDAKKLSLMFGKDEQFRTNREKLRGRIRTEKEEEAVE